MTIAPIANLESLATVRAKLNDAIAAVNSGGFAAGPEGTVQLSDGAGGLVASAFGASVTLLDDGIRLEIDDGDGAVLTLSAGGLIHSENSLLLVASGGANIIGHAGGQLIFIVDADTKAFIVGDNVTGPNPSAGDVNISGHFKRNGVAIDSGSLLSSGVISLSSAQLLDLDNTPIEIVAAPGPNEAIVPERVVSTLTFGTAAYPNISSNVGLIYGLDDEFNYSTFLAPFHGDVNTADSFVSFGIGEGSANYFKTVAAGNALNLTTLASTDPATGPILTTTLANGGSGYAPGDTGSIYGGNPSAEYIVDTVDGGGAVVTYTITYPGKGCSVATGVATFVSTGSGDSLFTLNITEIQPGDGTATIEVFYRLVTWP